MDTKFIFVTGGVVSSLGKGISAASVGLLLQKRGFKVFTMKFDPYLNVDPGTMSPYQHGEVFVTDDGAETDLDLGHYERWLDINLSKEASVTSGKIYSAVIEKERRGDYLGACVQVIPHVTNEIKKRLLDAAKASGADIVIAEIGGTVGDIESQPFLEAIRQARLQFGYDNTFFLHNTLVPYLKTSGETKTKPTQHSVKEMASLGLQPDAIILRSEVPLDEHTKEKVSLFCNVPLQGVFEADDAPIIYTLPKNLHRQGIDDFILSHFRLPTENNLPDLSDFDGLVEKIQNLSRTVKIALVGKYVELHDAYLSVSQALKAAGYHHDCEVEIVWIPSTEVKPGTEEKYFSDVDGILVPGGFGHRGSNGKKLAIRYAREHKIPFLGICFGMQLAIIEYAQDVLGLKEANSTEFDPETPYPVIDFLHNQYQGIDMGGTLRLGSYDCDLVPGTLAARCYGQERIKERHRHRYEFNNAFREKFEGTDMVFSGINPQANLVEIIELKNHPFFIAAQFHPEFTSRPLRPNPLFREFIGAAKANKR